MVVYEIMNELEYFPNENLVKATQKIIDDANLNKIKECNNLADIEKVKGILNTISGLKKFKVSGAQHYVLRFYIANNITNYCKSLAEVKDTVNKLSSN